MSSISDDFNTADSATLGHNLTWTDVAGDWQNKTNQADLQGGSGVSGMTRAETNLTTADHEVSLSVTALTGGFSTGTQIGACGRFSPSANTFYAARIVRNLGTDTLEFLKCVAGSLSAVGSPVSVTVSLPMTLKLRVADDGSGNAALTAYINGTSLNTAVDSSSPITGNLRTGFYGYRSDASTLTVAVDDFLAADISSFNPGVTSVVAATATTATVSSTAATGGTANYTYQFQRAEVIGGIVGSYVNIGSPQTLGTGVAPSNLTDTDLVPGSSYSYQVHVTDTASHVADTPSASLDLVGKPLVASDRVQETSTTTGTGTVTLAGALSGGYRTFGSQLTDGQRVLYGIKNGVEIEGGLGTWATGGKLSRDSVLWSSNSGNLLNLSGSSNVWIDAPATWFESGLAVDVRSFGAKGDNSTDDTRAIQQAIWAVYAAGGGIVRFPTGSFVVNGSGCCLLLPSKVILEGRGVATRLCNASTSADTIRCTGSRNNWTAYSDFWSIVGIHFNPKIGVTRDNAALEINIGATRQGHIFRCSFGRRSKMNSGDTAESTDEESRVGTCIQAGNSSLPIVGAGVIVNQCRGFGPYFRFIRLEKFVDLVLTNGVSDANNPGAQPIYCTGTVEGFQMSHFDCVNSAGVDGRSGSFTSGNVALLIDSDGVAFNTFTDVYLDTHYHGLYASGGYGNAFVNSWITSIGGAGLRLLGTASGYVFAGGTRIAATATDGASVEVGTDHLFNSCLFFGNNVLTGGTAHLKVLGAVAGLRAIGNSFATSRNRLTGNTMDAINVASGATGIRSIGNLLNSLAITNGAGAGYVSSLE